MTNIETLLGHCMLFVGDVTSPWSQSAGYSTNSTAADTKKRAIFKKLPKPALQHLSTCLELFLGTESG